MARGACPLQSEAYLEITVDNILAVEVVNGAEHLPDEPRRIHFCVRATLHNSVKELATAQARETRATGENGGGRAMKGRCNRDQQRTGTRRDEMTSLTSQLTIPAPGSRNPACRTRPAGGQHVDGLSFKGGLGGGGAGGQGER